MLEQSSQHSKASKVKLAEHTQSVQCVSLGAKNTLRERTFSSSIWDGKNSTLMPMKANQIRVKMGAFFKFSKLFVQNLCNNVQGNYLNIWKEKRGWWSKLGIYACVIKVENPKLASVKITPFSLQRLRKLSFTKPCLPESKVSWDFKEVSKLSLLEMFCRFLPLAIQLWFHYGQMSRDKLTAGVHEI